MAVQQTDQVLKPGVIHEQFLDDVCMNIRRVVDEARKAFFLSEEADRNEFIGNSFAHD